MLARLRSVIRTLLARDHFEQDMSDELRFHIEQYTADLIRGGASCEDAQRRARVQFGNVTTVQEECREARRIHVFDLMARNLRYATRLLRNSPGFTATALLTLAICIGANLTIFAALDAIWIRPLPFPDADRLVTIYNSYPKAGVERDGSSITNYYERRGRISALSSIALYRYETAIVGDSGSTARVSTIRVTPGFFSTLGMSLPSGREFTDEETTYQTDKVVVLTDAYWRQHFSADPGVLGRGVRVDGVPCVVVGVLPEGFRFLSSDAQLYLPLSSALEQRGPSQRHSGGNSRHLIGRLNRDATLEQAQAQIDAQNASLAWSYPRAKLMEAAGFRSVAVSLHSDHVESVRPTLFWIQAAAFALLLIGAVNLVNLLLIRASSRTKETAVRQALGAGRADIVTEVIAETLVLTLAGGFLGLLFGAGGIQLLSAMGSEQLPLGARIQMDIRLALVAIAGSVVFGIGLGVPIAWFNLHSRLATAIHAQTRGGTSSRGTQRLRHSFIVAQIALALVLLTGAGLLGLSLEHAMAVSPGFRPDHVLTGQIFLPSSDYSNWQQRLAFNRRLLEEIGSQPGVAAAGIVNNIPFSGSSGKSALTPKDYVPRAGEPPRGHYDYGVDGDYFAAMGFVLRQGRFLTANDVRQPAYVCVVDEDFARYYWPGRSAVGQQLFRGPEQRSAAEAFTVVGVVGVAKQAGLTEASAQGAAYFPFPFRTDPHIFVAIRTGLPSESLASRLQEIVRGIDGNLPVSDIRLMEARISDSLVARRSPALAAGIFSAIALLLTAIGAYGVLSYAVAQRRREIGLRMALGARPEQIRRQFLGLALRLLLTGTMLGVIGAWLTGQAMRALLFQVPALHAATLAGAVALMIAVCLVACMVPCLRAARVSPVEAMAND